MRKMTSFSTSNLQGELQCLECEYSFSTNEDFKNHKKSKEHLQKLRNARSKVIEHIRDSALNKHHILGKSDCVGQGVSLQHSLGDFNNIRKIETYRLATNKNYSDGYLSYIYSTIAYWATNLTFDPTVNDFSISLGEKAWDAFGNVTVKVQYVALPEKPATAIDYIIRFKHVVSNNAIMVNSFTEGIFNYEKLMRKILNIKDIDEENEDIRFYVFTTATIAPNLNSIFYIKFCKDCKKFQVACKCKHDDLEEAAFENVKMYGKSLSNSRNLLFNRSDDNGSVYRIISLESGNGYKLPSLYVYTSQKPLREMIKSINALIADFLEEVDPRLAKNFIKFIENWTQKNIGGSVKFKIKKEDVLVKLGELLLSRYRITPKIEKIEGKYTRFAIWVQAIKCADITVTQISNRKLSNLLEPFNILIENHLKNIQIASDCADFEDSVRITSEEIKRMEDNALKFYISNEASSYEDCNISLNTLYLIFWKIGVMPLTLNVNKSNQNYVFQVINLLKTRGLIRRYLINTTDENIRLFAKSWKNLSFFINLGDIANQLGSNIIENVKINLPNGSISLFTIQKTDQFFQKSIFPYEFFEMTLNKYQLKLNTYHIEPQESTEKLVLNHKWISTFLQSMKNDNGNRNNEPFQILRNINPNLFSRHN